MLACALLAAAPLAALHDLPAPPAGGLEPAVSAQIVEARSAVERLLSGASGASPDALAKAFGELGELYLLYDLVADAEPCLENAAELAPRAARWPYLLGALHQGRGDGERAEAALRSALELRPSDLPTLLRLGNALLDQARLGEARAVFERALAVDSRSAAALDGLGRAALAAKEYAVAIERFGGALAIQPQATSLHYRLGLAHRALGDLERARAELEQGGETQVTFADPVLDAARRRLTGVGALVRMGQLAASSGAAGAAEERFRAALALDPESPEAHYALATLLETEGRADEALAQYLEALRHGLQNVPVALHAADLLRAAGRPGDAASILARTAESATDSAELAAELAATLEEAGEREAALDAYRRALALEADPERRARLLFHRAGLEAASGRGAMAEATLLEALNLDPDLAEAHFNLGTLYARRGDLGSATAHLARAADLRPDDAVPQLAVSMALLLSDRPREAVDRLEASLERLSGQPVLEHLLARVLAASSLPAVRDAARALGLAQALVEAQPTADHLETLAMALAASARFDDAVAAQERAIAAIEGAGSGAGALTAARRRLDLYRGRRPVLDPWKG
jgi:tetratricopeptide (TPR) repeat protein